MNYSHILKRTNINYLENLILDGLDGEAETKYKTYAERLRAADEKINAMFKAQFSELEEYNEITAYHGQYVKDIQDVYFEIGLIVGGKFAFDISKRMEELK